ncbi:gliding motility-associated C-terminal domain-containing protein [Mucilaginibacter boryungensis]
MIVTPSDCKGGTGAITGIQGTGTGTLVYTWYDSSNAVVGSAPDLTDVPAGTYKLTLKDDSKCPAAVLNVTIVELNPIVIDNTTTVISSPACNVINGSITNITIKNATSYLWIDTTDNSTIANTKDLLNVNAGTYKLIASNNGGCFRQSTYTIPLGPSAPVMTAYSITNSDCKGTGMFQATFDMKSNSPGYQYSLTTPTGKEVNSGGIFYSPVDSTRIKITDLLPGNYIIRTAGSDGCVTKLLSFTIGINDFKVDTREVVIHTDICGRAVGTITGLKFTGGPPPSVFAPPGTGNFWFDNNGNRVPQGLTYLAGVAAGKYTYYGINANGCKTQTVTFIIPDSVSAASAPVLDDMKICLPANVALSVKNQDKDAYYYLYDDEKNLIDSAKTGYFTRKINETSTYYIGAVNGICISPLGKVVIMVVNPGVSFPNAFTPNNDGINDTWNIIGLDQYPGTEVSVFDRTGSRVYHAINYAQPFNGKLNGVNLPAGTYYYIIDTKKPGCQNGITGNLTLIR